MVGISHPISWFIIYNFNIMVRCKVFFFWQNFIKFWPEKYDFDLCKGFLMKEMTQIFQILKIKIKKSFFLVLSYLACNQMWLNHFMDDGQLSYITKLKKKKTPSISCPFQKLTLWSKIVDTISPKLVCVKWVFWWSSLWQFQSLFEL